VAGVLFDAGSNGKMDNLVDYRTLRQIINDRLRPQPVVETSACLGDSPYSVVEELQSWKDELSDVLMSDIYTLINAHGLQIVTLEMLDIVGGIWQEKVLVRPIFGRKLEMRQAPKLRPEYGIEEPEKTIYGKEGLKCHKIAEDIPLIT